MATSSILGGDRAPMQPAGTDIDALGPSDTSDSGSDVQTDLNRTALPDEASEGAIPLVHDSDSTSSGTGERASSDPTMRGTNQDILPDQVVSASGDVLDDAISLDDPAAQELAELAVPEDDDNDDETLDRAEAREAGHGDDTDADRGRA